MIPLVGWLKIEWDTNKKIYPYRYGLNHNGHDKYDVKVCDEPRILKDELIAPGCLVTRGTYKIVYIWYIDCCSNIDVCTSSSFKMVLKIHVKYIFNINPCSNIYTSRYRVIIKLVRNL